ncbi:hypothetical protein EJ05DRAFT_475553 [Pseudovirgaria hyperparasitica]|uniref:Serine-threonine protein kinase 19 n=1 Tax=Pseudovirgaria hyperparasitica TaxID=470096 RepID=A0A6A6W8X1_9PEZI|nr:uncharacterized protein EJ05DRAFT_475553 [Pseudovirgaria hyperparasitica]KAF2759328.1 hypothetical protein EJ05DRAFT_475553 [Pseudovirgaria hyperparasitica]
MLVTGAQSSKVKKKRSSILRRSSSSPFSSARRRKPSLPKQSSKLSTKRDEGDDIFEDPLDDTGVIASLASDLSLRDVAQFTENIHRRMFDEIPERGSGMNSTRIAEVLNYRKNLPPIVTIAHIHALSRSITRADREIAELSQAGIVRKLIVPNRGAGASNVGEGLVLVPQWEKRVRGDPHLATDIQEKYISLLRTNSTSLSISATSLSPSEASALTSTGFLTSSTQSRSTIMDTYFRPGTGTFSTLTSLSSVGHKSASGAVEAVGGSGAFVSSGGSASGVVQKSSSNASRSAQYNYALPNTGPLLKLIVEARTHLLSLISKTSKYKEAPLDMLRERWDGGTADAPGSAKKMRGEFTGVLPARTKKWKSFNGLCFEWILEECVGAGLIELFETRSVGRAARLVQ